jgi:coenzyme F420 hydrogenase subunit beta
MSDTTRCAPARPTFKHMIDGVVDTGACSECGSCVVVCPHRIIEMRDRKPAKRPGSEGAHDHCGVSVGIGCDACAAVCPRLWPREPALRDATFHGDRGFEGIFGVYRHVFVARARDPVALERGQDGGVVTALLAWARETGAIDGAVVAAVGDGDAPCFPVPKLATTPDQIRASAGSWYTYSPNTLALKQLAKAGVGHAAFVGVPCQITALRKMERIDTTRLLGAAKSPNVHARQRDCLRGPAERVAVSVGLFCSEVFRPELMTERVAQEMGVALDGIAKVNIKGEVLIHGKDGSLATIPLDEAARDYQRPECRHCGDFSAELADIACGGVGTDRATVVVLRTERGVALWREFEASGRVEVWPIQEHKKAWNILQRLARKQRERIAPPPADGNAEVAPPQYSAADEAVRARQALVAAGCSEADIEARLQALRCARERAPVVTGPARPGRPIPGDPGEPSPGEKRRLPPPPAPHEGGASPVRQA